MTALKGRADNVRRLIRQSFLIFLVSSLANKIKTVFRESVIFNLIIDREATESLARESLFCGLFRRFFEAFEIENNVLQRSVLLGILSNYGFFAYATVFFIPLLGTMPLAFLACVTVVSYLLSLVVNSSGHSFFRRRGFGVTFLFTVCFSAVSCISAFSSYTASASVKIWLLYFIFILFSLVICDLSCKHGELRRILLCFALSLCIVSLLGIYQQFFDFDIGQKWIDLEMFGTSGSRVYSTFGNPNVFGEYLILLIPVVFSLMLTVKDRRIRVFYFLCCVFSGMSLLYTQSRGCWLAFVLAFAIYLAFVDRRFVILLLILAVVSPYIMPDFVVKRFMSIGDMRDTSTSYRVYIWLGTLNMLRDYWFCGVGLGSEAFSKVYTFYSYSSVSAPQAHNLYLQIISEMGLAGLVSFILIVFFWYKDAASAYFSSACKRRSETLLLLGICAGVTAFLIQGMFDYVFYNYRVVMTFWVMLGLGVGAVGAILKGEQPKQL